MSEFLEIVSKQSKKDVDELLTKLISLDEKITQINEKAKNSVFPSQNKKIIQEVNTEIAKSNKIVNEAERFNKKLARSEENVRFAKSRTGQQTIKNRQETAKTNKETRSLGSAYDKLRFSLDKAEKEYRDLAASQGLSNKATIRAQKNVQNLRKRVDDINKPIKRLGDNVGNYPKRFNVATSALKGFVGAFGIIEGVRLAFDFTKESIQLAKQAKGIQFAFVRLGDEGQDAFGRIKKSTRGLLSDLDIKRSLVEFDNFNLSLEQSDVLFEFLAVRAAQTGKSIDSLKDSLVEGLSKESKLRIDNLGISASELNSELEKTPDFVEAVANIAKREVKEAGSILDDTANSTEKWGASLENAKVAFGQLFTETDGIDLLGILITVINDVTKGIRVLKSGIDTIVRGFNDFLSPIKEIIKEFPFLSDLVTKVSEKFKNFTDSQALNQFAAIGTAFKVIGASLSGVGAVISKLKESFKDFFSSFRAFANIDFSNPLQALKQIGQASSSVFKNAVSNSKNLSKTFKDAFIDALRPVEEINETLEKNITTNDKVSESVGKSNNKRAKEAGLIEKTIKFYNSLIDQQKRVAFSYGVTSEEATTALNNVSDLEKKIKDLKLGILFDETNTFSLGFDLPKEGELESVFEGIKNSVKPLTEEMIELRKSTDEFIKSISIDFISNSPLPSLTTFFDGTFDSIISGANTFQEKFAATFQAVGNLANDSLTILNNQQQLRFDRELSRLDQEKEIALAFAGESAEARGAIEEDFAERKRRIQIKQARAEKDNATFQAIINTAAAVVSALKTGPGLAFTVGLLGAAQIALIQGTPVPNFEKGTDFAPGGLSLVNDQKGSSFKEMIRTPKGDVLRPQKRNTLIDLPRGSQVFTASETSDFDNGLKSLLANNGIIPMRDGLSGNITVKSNYNGITKGELYDVMSDTIGSIQTNNVSIDKNGIKTLALKQYSRTELLNNKVSFKGRKV